MSDLNIAAVSTSELASTTPERPKPPVVSRMDVLKQAHNDWVRELNDEKSKFDLRKKADITGLSKEMFQDPPKSPDATRYSELYDIASPIEHFDLGKTEEYKELLESVTTLQSGTEDEKDAEERYTKAEALFNRTFIERGKPEDAIKILKSNPDILHSSDVQSSIGSYLDKSLNSAPQYISAADKSREFLNELYDIVLSETSPAPEALKDMTEQKQNIVLGIKIQKDLIQNSIGTPEQHNKKREELLAKTNRRLKSTGSQEVTLHEGVSSGKVDSFKQNYKKIYGKELGIGTDGYFQASLSLAEQAKDMSSSEKTRKTAQALAIGMAIAQPIERTKKESHQCSKDQTLTVLFTDLDHPEVSSVQKLRGNQELHALFTHDNQLEYDYGLLKTQNEASVVYGTKATEDQEAKRQAETKRLNEEKIKAEQLADEVKTKTEAAALQAWKAEQLEKYKTTNETFPQKDRFNLFGVGFGGKTPDLNAGGQSLRTAIASETDPIKKTFLATIKF